MLCSTNDALRCPPAEGLLKLNVDASKYPGSGGVGVAGVISDSRGIVFGGLLQCHRGDFSVEIAELVAIRDGLRFSLNNGFNSLVVECTCYWCDK